MSSKQHSSKGYKSTFAEFALPFDILQILEKGKIKIYL